MLLAPSSSALPAFCGAVDQPLMRWLHRQNPTARHGSLAVLLCAPLGDEDLAVYRGMRRIAEALAEAGHVAMRFDYAGCGDSYDIADVHADKLPFWLGSLDAAIDDLKACSGASHVVLIGARSGALLAAQALGRHDVAGLAAIAPVSHGRGWLRECRLLGAALGHPVPADGAVQAGGFVINACTVRSVGALDWRGASLDRPLRALIVDRPELPSGAPCHAGLTARGAQVDTVELDGLARWADMAHRSALPPALVERLLRWVARVAADHPAAAAAAGPSSASREVVQAVLHTGGATIEEAVVAIGTAPELVGVVSRRRDAAPVTESAGLRRGVLLLASGSERRIGPHRLFVPFARERAARGDVVLRLDRAGIGDSAVRPGGVENDSFDALAVADVVAALAYLRLHCGVGPCVLVGLCAGAFHAWQAALAGVDCTLVVSVNPVVYDRQGAKTTDPREQAFVQVAIMADARRGLRDPRRWVKLARGQVHLRLIAGAVAARARAHLHGLVRHTSRQFRRPLRDDLATDLSTVAQRGVRQRFVFSEGEPGEVLLRQQGAGILRRLQHSGMVGVHTIAGADHTFTGSVARNVMYQQLHAALDEAPSLRLSPKPAQAVERRWRAVVQRAASMRPL